MDKREVLMLQREGPQGSPLNNHQGRDGFYNSEDDQLNNDFFYDEEFNIPFDANLVNESWNIGTSKSDSFLCKLGRDYDRKQQRNGKIDDEDSDSSEASSELTNQPLFSSHSECPDEFVVEEQGKDDVFKDDKESTPEWKSPDKQSSCLKQHYKLSYDRGPFKIWSSGDETISKSSLEYCGHLSKPVSKSTTLSRKGFFSHFSKLCN